ncbi:MAG: hypothetical protein EZS28_009151 [Streblomastix strix]|uniref:General stress protein FMN-binding split barrel domain-containing protein n=1 Tax=Streblomastix strix TaxID=222440 RepID=A0A5J4WK83_9EUKA|nr:MAG: hypothetical protein EZS28_009151 [Streblomastix strix]
MSNEAEKFLLTLKKNFMWSILTTTDKTRPVPRIVNLRYIPELGFIITTRTYWTIIEQVEKNPIGTISIYPGKGYDTAVAHVTLRVTKDRKILDASWDDYMLNIGYKSKNDDFYRVALITIHSVTFGKDTYSGIPIDGSIYDHIAQDELAPLPSGPFKTKEISELLKKTFTPMKNGNLITMNGLEHDVRIMEVRYKEDIGLYTTTQLESRKVKQISANQNAALHVDYKGKYGQLVVDAVAKISSNPEIKKKIWNDGMKQYGYSGPDDEKLVVILFTPRRVILHQSGSHIPEVLVAEPVQ